MIGNRYGRAAAGFGVGLAVLAGAVTAGAGSAGAANKTISLGHKIEVTLAKGWTAGKVHTGKIAITQKSTHAVIDIIVGPNQTVAVATALNTNFRAFVAGFDLTGVTTAQQQSGQIVGKAFTQGASFAYTGLYKAEKLGGVAIEYLNAKTKVGAFAVVITKQSDVNKIQQTASQILQSLATNP